MRQITLQAFIQKGILFSCLILFLFSSAARSQGTRPTLRIKSLGTNVYSITTTNNIGTATYDLLWTPEINNVDYPWTWAVTGVPGQTNYTVNTGIYPTGLFRTLLDTNAIPLWEAASQTNPSNGVLTVTIDNPTNGAVIQ